jgi:tRNA dimethylallyltransferase
MELILLLGCTSSGKSDMAVELANKLPKSVIVSCDSRQVYKGLDLLSGKVEGKIAKSNHFIHDCYLYSSIEHFLIDVVDLDIEYNLDRYINDFIYLINNLNDVDYVILTGGTGLYARAIYDQYQLNTKIQNPELNELTIEQLQSQLNQNDFNNSDWNNKIRLLNKLSTTDNSKTIQYPEFTKKSKYIININKTIIATRVHDRIVSRIKNGMIEELEKLISIYGYDKMLRLGLEPRYCSYYLLGMINMEELIKLLDYQTMQYVKRQMTWLKAEKNSIWIDSITDIKTLD